jgi:CMP-N-acetylneuraminic acid synthetase
MATDRDALIVVPARGGSVGIPRKAVRLLNGKAPLTYTLETVREIAETVVMTDDAEIRALAGAAVYEAVYDVPDLGLDLATTTWEPFVYRVVTDVERARGKPYEAIAVVQCTSPFLRSATIHDCLRLLESHPVVMTVVDDRHARIGTPRMPRQQMPPCWKVTGGVTAVRRSRIAADRWNVDDAYPYVVHGAEAVDLDTIEDWWLAERYAGLV